MNYFSIDFLIVYVFLTITIIIAIRAGRGIKDIREYALGNRTYGTLTLILTFLATNIGGSSLVSGSAGVFSNGIIRIIPELGVMLQALFFAFFIAPKVLRFNTCLTIGDVIGMSYGKLSKPIAGILGVFYSIAMVSMELVGLGIIMEALLGIKAVLSIIIGGIFLSFYASHGGIKSVTATDVFQFLVLIIVIPLLANTALKHARGIEEVFMHLPSSKLEIFEHNNFSYYLTLFLVWSIFPVGVTSPPIFQRLLMASNSQQLRTQYLVVSIFHPILQLLIMLIGLAGFILYPTIKANDLVPHIIQELLPIGGKGLAIAGVLAIFMSTVDSYLHAAGLIFTNDIVKPICGIKGWAFNELRLARQVTVIIGIASILIALQSTSMLSLSFLAVKFTGPLLMFPLIAAIRGLEIDKNTFYLATVITLIVFALTSWLLPLSYCHLAVPISIAVNGIVLFGVHYATHKQLSLAGNYTLNILRKPKKKALLASIKRILPTPHNIINYSRHQVFKYGAPYMLFGGFFVINYVLPFFMWTHGSTQAYNFMFMLRLIGGTLCGLLITREKWPKNLLPYMPIFWHLSVMYCLPFMSTMMFLLTESSTEWLINVAIMIILLFILLDWATALVLGSLGIVFAFSCYRLFIGELDLSLNFSSAYLLIYQGIFGLLIGLIFARRKEQRFDKLATDNQTLTLVDQENKEALLEIFKEKIRLLKTLRRAGVQDLTKAVSLVKELRIQESQGFKEPTTVHSVLDQLQNTLTPMAVALERIESRATDYMRLEVNPITIDSLLEAVQAKFSYVKLHIENRSTCQELICDSKRIQKMLLNSLETLKTFVEEGASIYIILADTQLSYPLPSVKKDKSYVKKVPALAIVLSTIPDISNIQTTYKAQMRTSALRMPETPTSFLLAANQRIVKAHYGYTNIDISRQKNYNMHCYVLPRCVSDVRPRDMDDPYMELGAELVRADDTFPGALEQEKAFLAAVKQRSNANLAAIETAIEIIKWYHGPVKRKSGEPFYLHPLAVAHIVLDYNTDEVTILGALLHDIVEDTPMVLENLEMMFGKEVVGIVDGVTHFESVQESFYKVQLAPHENIMMLLGVEDKRILYVKIADRLHNMRTIEGHSSYVKKKQIAEETLQFFVPLAKKLGLEEAAAELQQKSMAVFNQQES